MTRSIFHEILRDICFLFKDQEMASFLLHLCMIIRRLPLTLCRSSSTSSLRSTLSTSQTGTTNFRRASGSCPFIPLHLLRLSQLLIRQFILKVKPISFVLILKICLCTSKPNNFSLIFKCKLTFKPDNLTSNSILRFKD